MKKKLIVLTAVAALGAAAVPAMAFENEFHGSYTAAGFITNAYNSGTGAVILDSDAKTNNFVDQRARLQYIAKASDDLKLVTHFELDTKFGGRTGGKYTNQGDAGGLDADGINLETKNVYLDFNIPGAPVNAKVGILPWADSYKGVFGIGDDTGARLTGTFGPATVALGFYRLTDANGALAGTVTDPKLVTPLSATANKVTNAKTGISGKDTVDLVTVDGKFAVNKDITVGANYSALLRDAGTVGGDTAIAEFTNVVGLNVAAKFGPAAVDAFFGYQFGDYDTTTDEKIKLRAFGLGGTGKVQAGPGTASFSALYLSGQKNDEDDKATMWQSTSANQTYYNDANMWFLVRNPLSINTSAALGSNDLTKGGQGLFGVFAGYNGGINKLLFGANAGYAQVAQKWDGQDGKGIGTEFNAMVGYKLYDNLTAKFNVAYCFLGKLAKYDDDGEKNDKPYLTNLTLQYAF